MRLTLVVDRLPSDKMKVSSLAWDEPHVLLAGEVLQVRNKANQLHITRLPVSAAELEQEQG